ncbi:germination protein YpeB [Gorillibacterium timonense]|uniref:germination protein YpeB n=1 Tax=Gorillibacterium timonense TaxID=1689269 RepID=UPI00071D6EB0|nr:germination protein YpeB [Gorillibacterium timonense]
MYKSISAVVMPIAVLVAIGLGVWGYQVNTEKNTILIKAENQYQRSFHDLSHNLGQLQDELGGMVAVNPTKQAYYRRQMINVWRITNQAKTNITQLPLTMLPFDKTQELLHRLSKFSYQTSIRDLEAKPLTAAEKKTLASLYECTKDIDKELSQVQTKILSSNLRWMDVEAALASQKENQDNVIIDGFKTLNKKAEGYGELDFGPSAMQTSTRQDLNKLPGKELSAMEIRKKAQQFLGLSDGSALKVTENGPGTEFNSYTVAYPVGGNNEELTLDYSKKGGHLLQFMRPRSIGNKVLDAKGAQEAAKDFLNEHGFADMKLINYDEYQRTAALTFAHEQNGVLVYPESVMLNVALDNGQVTDMRAANYHFEKKDRTFDKPKMTLKEASKELNPNFNVLSTRQSLIEGELGDQVRCYEFLGKINGKLYRVYINGETGYEEKVESLHDGSAI